MIDPAMSEPLVPPRFVFHFSLPCRHRDPLWTDKGLEPKYRLASFAELDAAAAPAEFRAAWSQAGLAFTVLVTGKRQPPWCRASRPDESDGVQLWIDTRNVHNVHRASRFCHRFLFMPSGAGNRLDQPAAQWLPINRAGAAAGDRTGPAPGPQPEAVRRLRAGDPRSGRGLDRLRSGGASAAGVQLRPDRPRAGSPDAERGQSLAV